MKLKTIFLVLVTVLCLGCTFGLSHVNKDDTLFINVDERRDYLGEQFNSRTNILDDFEDYVNYIMFNPMEYSSKNGVAVLQEYPIVTEEIYVLDLIDKVGRINFPFDKDAEWLTISSEDALFQELQNLLEGVYLSPIDYSSHIWGGGCYLENNEFHPDQYFLFGYYPTDIGRHEETEVLANTRFSSDSLDFYLDTVDGLIYELRLFENYNLVLTCKVSTETNDIYQYQLPYCLQGNSRELLVNLIEFTERNDLTEYIVPYSNFLVE